MARKLPKQKPWEKKSKRKARRKKRKEEQGKLPDPKHETSKEKRGNV